MEIQPLELWRNRTRLVDDVAAELRRRIYAGVYPPGSALRQEEVAQQLAVSRTPVRDALSMLVREGLLESTSPSGGVRVITTDPDTLVAAYRMREVVDGLAARLAAEAASPALSADLQQLISEQEEALSQWEPRSWTPHNVRFHSRIMHESSNRHLLSQMPLVHMTSHVFSPIGFLEKARAEQAFEEHRRIADAVTRGDPDAAESEGRSHIRTTLAALSAAAGTASTT